MNIIKLALVLLSLFLFNYPAMAESTNGKTVHSLDQIGGNIKNKDGLSAFMEEMNGDTRPDGFGTKLPEGISRTVLTHTLSSTLNTSFVTLAGMKRWPYAKDTYIAIACVAPDLDSYYKALSYNNNYPFCEPGLVNKKGQEYNISVGIIKYANMASQPVLVSSVTWGQEHNNPLIASWNHSNLGAPAGIEDKSDKEQFITSTSLYQFDFAPFRINKDIVAFGIRSGMNEGYAGGGANFQIITLFALIDGILKPVLSQPIYYFSNTAGNWHEDGTRDHYLEEGENIIRMLPQSTNGFYDIEISSKDGKWHQVFVWDKKEQKYMPVN